MPTLSTHLTHWRALMLAVLLLAGITACGGDVTAAPKPTPTATRTAKLLPTATPQPRPTAKPAAPQATPAAGATTVVVTEQQIDALLDNALAGQENLPLTDTAVRLDPGVIVGTGRVKMGFLNAKLELHLQLSADDGKLEPKLVQVLMDGKPAPAFVKNQIDSLAAPYLAQARAADPGFYVETVTITGDEVRIVGK